jgi:hypothetical protein
MDRIDYLSCDASRSERLALRDDDDGGDDDSRLLNHFSSVYCSIHVGIYNLSAQH